MNNIYAQGAVVSVIGLCTVFLVLAILWGVLELMRVFFTAPKKQTKPAKAQSAPAPAAPAPAPVAVADDGELIAVLTAAIAASLNRPASSLNIRSYRKVGTAAPAWNQVARRDNLIG
ncbi:MAG: OadG family protein [Clostridia bacterium]|nr:OadG family protein [Clostridia bacterium]